MLAEWRIDLSWSYLSKSVDRLDGNGELSNAMVLSPDRLLFYGIRMASAISICFCFYVFACDGLRTLGTHAGHGTRERDAQTLARPLASATQAAQRLYPSQQSLNDVLWSTTGLTFPQALYIVIIPGPTTSAKRRSKHIIIGRPEGDEGFMPFAHGQCPREALASCHRSMPYPGFTHSVLESYTPSLHVCLTCMNYNLYCSYQICKMNPSSK